MPLLERARVEAYVPDLPLEAYDNLLEALDREFTYAFGGCTISRGLEGSYLSRLGVKTPDRINLIYTDLPVAFSTDFQNVARYVDEVKIATFEALTEESILVAVTQVFHAV